MSVRNVIDRVLDKQNAKGMATYGQTLDDCPDESYDWKMMAIEELADGIQYLAKENQMLEKQLRIEKTKRMTAERQFNQLDRGESNGKADRR